MARHFGLRFALALSGLLVGSQSFAKDYIIKFKSNTSAQAAASFAFFEGGTIRDSHPKANLIKVDLGITESLADEAKMVVKLLARPDVEYVVEDFKLRLVDGSSTTETATQWSLQKVNAASAWSLGKGSRKVTVAVIDTGTDYTHVDLKGNMVSGYNFIEDNDDPQDITEAGGNPGHGTHCAGIIGGLGIDGAVSGISPQVSIMPLRFIGPSGQGDLISAIKAMDYAIEKKVDVVSASWGANVSESQAKPLIEAVSRLNDAGIIFVAAAGNEGANNDRTEMYPVNANFPNVIAVAASDSADKKPYWSNYGRTKVSIAAPGADILSTLPDNSYGNLSGTSMATPLVAGLVALLKSQNDVSLNASETRALLQATGAQVNIESACNCRVDAGAASDALKTKKLILVPSAETFRVGQQGKFSALGGSGTYSFVSATPELLEVAADGTLIAKATGDAKVKVTDANGAVAESIALHINAADGGNGECPFGAAICHIACTFNPKLAWCPAKKAL
jgi:thermitase